jgi:basic membrane lipoprotein Med (substrate-binding protein (PBP1-ABC) superfamily)
MKTAGGTVAGLVIGAAGGYFAGLGAQPSVTQPGVTQTVTQAQTVTQTVAKGGQKAKVAMIMSGTIDDGGWNQGHYAGLKRLSDMGYETSYTELVAPPDTEKVARDYVGLGYNLILYNGGWAREGYLTVSKAFPETAHVLVEGFEEDKGPNTEIIMDQEQESGFIMAQIAARLTKKKVIGWAVGMETADLNLWNAGIRAGLKAVDPSIKPLYAVIGSFEDPAKGKEAALSMIEAGADVILEGGDGTSFGIAAAAREYKIPLISASFGSGNFSETKGAALGSDVSVGGAFIDWAATYVPIVKTFDEGKFGYRGYYPSVSNRQIKIVLNPAFESQFRTLVNDLVSKIERGEMVVPTLVPP